MLEHKNPFETKDNYILHAESGVNLKTEAGLTGMARNTIPKLKFQNWVEMNWAWGTADIVDWGAFVTESRDKCHLQMLYPSKPL